MFSAKGALRRATRAARPPLRAFLRFVSAIISPPIFASSIDPHFGTFNLPARLLLIGLSD
jgi:hypothetical protein